MVEHYGTTVASLPKNNSKLMFAADHTERHTRGTGECKTYKGLNTPEGFAAAPKHIQDLWLARNA